MIPLGTGKYASTDPAMAAHQFDWLVERCAATVREATVGQIAAELMLDFPREFASLYWILTELPVIWAG